MNELHLFAGAGMRTCSTCKVTKPMDAYYVRKDGVQSICIQCATAASRAWYARNPTYSKEKAKAWREANPEVVKAYRVANRRKSYLQEAQRKYGILPERFAELMATQGERCATCRKPFDWGDKQTKPHIDHCHGTGKVRGILCNRCNTVLGLVADNKTILTALAGYLE